MMESRLKVAEYGTQFLRGRVPPVPSEVDETHPVRAHLALRGDCCVGMCWPSSVRNSIVPLGSSSGPWSYLIVTDFSPRWIGPTYSLGAVSFLVPLSLSVPARYHLAFSTPSSSERSIAVCSDRPPPSLMETAVPQPLQGVRSVA